MQPTIDKDNAWKLVPLARSYDMRARAILAFNTATANGADRDDALQAAWEAEYAAAPAADPIHQYQKADGSWIDQTPQSYLNNQEHAAEKTRIVYATPAPAPSPDAEVEALFEGRAANTAAISANCAVNSGETGQ